MGSTWKNMKCIQIWSKLNNFVLIFNNVTSMIIECCKIFVQGVEEVYVEIRRNKYLSVKDVFRA